MEPRERSRLERSVRPKLFSQLPRLAKIGYCLYYLFYRTVCNVYELFIHEHVRANRERIRLLAHRDDFGIESVYSWAGAEPHAVSAVE